MSGAVGFHRTFPKMMKNLGDYYFDPYYFEMAAAIEPYIAWYMPYSFFAYFGQLLVTYGIKLLLGPKFVINQTLQFIHNMFLCAQSLFLVYIIVTVYFDTADMCNTDPWSLNGFKVAALECDRRFLSTWLHFGHVAFQLSKIYETVDTLILIINGKPLILLHVWHHATTYLAFYMGLFTGAGIWIGFFNSAIHVVMYAYYAKIPGMKVIAKYITSMQIFHLFGGAACNLYTIIWPIIIPNTGKGKRYQHIDIGVYSQVNMCICLSYFFLFLAFFSKKYDKNGKGSIFSFLKFPVFVQKMIYGFQKTFFPAAFEEYLLKQGLCVPEAAVTDKPAPTKEAKKEK